MNLDTTIDCEHVLSRCGGQFVFTRATFLLNVVALTTRQDTLDLYRHERTGARW